MRNNSDVSFAASWENDASLEDACVSYSTASVLDRKIPDELTSVCNNEIPVFYG